MKDLQGTRVLILGAARQGTALARFLCARGATVTINDIQPREKLTTSIQALSDYDVNWVLGEHPLTLLDKSDLVCLSGGVPLTLPLVAAARKRGIMITNDSQIFMEHVKAPVVGITGSAGKTTTTSLFGSIAQAALQAPCKAWVGGNIGNPLIEFVEEIQPRDLVILELSSFQLELMTTSPHIAALLNITPNHLDRHAGMAEYISAKARILTHQAAGDFAILNHEDRECWKLRHLVRGSLVTFGLAPLNEDLPQVYLKDENIIHRAAESETTLFSRGSIQLRGDHNLMNVLAACALSTVIGLDPAPVKAAVASFRGVSHREEIVRVHQGVTWINDSIATAPERTLAAVRAFHEPLILLLGGRDKNLPWNSLVKAIHDRVDHVIVFGEAAEKIISAIKQPYLGSGLQSLCHANTMIQALEESQRIANPGDVVLLSPGCTSYDAFKDFEERGNAFRDWVNQL